MGWWGVLREKSRGGARGRNRCQELGGTGLEGELGLVVKVGVQD